MTKVSRPTTRISISIKRPVDLGEKLTWNDDGRRVWKLRFTCLAPSQTFEHQFCCQRYKHDGDHLFRGVKGFPWPENVELMAEDEVSAWPDQPEDD